MFILLNEYFSILVFPLSGFLLFFVKPFFTFPEYQFVAMLLVMVTFIIFVSCVLNPNSLAVLSYIFRSGLNYQLIQHLFLFCVKIEIFVSLPSLARRALWFYFLVVYCFWLLQSIEHSYFCFLSLSEALLTLRVIYNRLGIYFYNADFLGIEVNQRVTFGESLFFLDKSLINEPSNFINNKSFSLSSPLCCLLSKRSNHFILPFLIQTRGMTTKAGAEVTAKALVVINNNSGAFSNTAVGAGVLSVGATLKAVLDDYQNNKKLAADSKEKALDRAAQAKEKALDRVADTEEKALNRTSEAQNWSRQSLDTLDKSESDFYKANWFKRNLNYLDQVQEGKVFHRDLLTAYKSVPL